ncbi:MAG: dipeptide ABC transporter ATP-binding protein [Egibacteraceae bacterium]
MSTTAGWGSRSALTPALLEVDDLHVSFPSENGLVTAVRGMSYQLAPGEVLGIVGESGSGKSVSALAVMGLLPGHAQVTGSIRFRGVQLRALGDAELSEIRGRGISMIFQDPLSALTPVYTVGDQVAEAVRVHQRVAKDVAAKRAVDLLDLVGIPDPAARARSFPHEFSGGMRQRVMIAMAVANDPDVIIADEPTTALDVTIQAQVLEVLKTARQATGAAIVLITHDLGVVAGIADHVLVMYAGKPVETGDVDDLFAHPRMPYTIGLLGSIPRLDQGQRQPLTPIEGSPPSLVDLPAGCPFAPRCPLRIDECEQVEPALELTGAAGHLAACHRLPQVEARQQAAGIFPDMLDAQPAGARVRDERPHEEVLSVRGLVKHFPLTRGSMFRRQVGTVRAVDGLSFDLRARETLGVVGESGCGKTTTILEIMSLKRPAAGEIVVLGHDTATLSVDQRRRIRRDLSIVFQDPLASLDPRMPVGEILAEPLRTHGVPAARRRERIVELLDLVGLAPEHANRYPVQFSGGQRQRIGIARALALEPKVVVLDEPVSSLDVSIQAGVLNLLERLRVELGLSYLFVSHDLAVVRHIADRVAVMYLGRIVEIGAVDRVFDAPTHPYTQALLSAIPLPDPPRERERRRVILEGDLPSPAEKIEGCRFRTRCPTFAQLDEASRQRCINQDPPLTGQGDDHHCACHYAQARSVI